MQPSSFQFSGGAEFTHGRWSAAPQASFGLQNLSGQGNHNVQFGYHAAYSLKPDVWLSSSLSNQYASANARVQRTSILTFGVQKSLNSNPVQWLSSKFERRTIRGRVFVDRTGDGAYHQGDQGLAGIMLYLSDGSSTTTNARGEFEFHGISPRLYHVKLPIEQFRTAVRFTGPSDAVADLTGAEKVAEVDFGVVDFARVLGVVYNDYLMDGERQPDAPRIGDVRLTLTRVGEAPHTATTDAGGEFDIAGLEPGHYEVAVDPESLPAGYFISGGPTVIDLAPASASKVELPLRAMRTISGKVLFREKADDPRSPTRPLAGVMLTADHTVVKTGADGTFILRNLPAGDLILRVLPNADVVPEGVQLPQGKLHLPFEPKQIENVVIVISNPDLLNHLLPGETQSPAATGR